jgi:multidrug resistance efflux pump
VRSLPELGALLSECSADLTHDTVAVENAEASLERAKAKQANTLQRFEALSEEFEAAKAAALAKGLRQGEAPAAPTPNVFDAGLDALNSAFDRATTPQGGNGVAF